MVNLTQISDAAWFAVIARGSATSFLRVVCAVPADLPVYRKIVKEKDQGFNSIKQSKWDSRNRILCSSLKVSVLPNIHHIFKDFRASKSSSQIGFK